MRTRSSTTWKSSTSWLFAKLVLLLYFANYKINNEKKKVSFSVRKYYVPYWFLDVMATLSIHKSIRKIDHVVVYEGYEKKRTEQFVTCEATRGFVIFTVWIVLWILCRNNLDADIACLINMYITHNLKKNVTIFGLTELAMIFGITSFISSAVYISLGTFVILHNPELFNCWFYIKFDKIVTILFRPWFPLFIFFMEIMVSCGAYWKYFFLFHPYKRSYIFFLLPWKLQNKCVGHKYGQRI